RYEFYSRRPGEGAGKSCETSHGAAEVTAVAGRPRPGHLDLTAGAALSAAMTCVLNSGFATQFKCPAPAMRCSGKSGRTTRKGSTYMRRQGSRSPTTIVTGRVIALLSFSVTASA